MCVSFVGRRDLSANDESKLVMKKLFRRWKSKRGQTLVEYALILAFISTVAIAVLINVGTNLKDVYTKIDSGIASAQASH
jgi:Flp pilus assembly pilin Flp